MLQANIAGGLTGALIGMGIPEYEAKRYEGKVKDGNILLSVPYRGQQRARSCEENPRAGGAVDISYTGEAFCSQGTAASRSLITCCCRWDLFDPTYKPPGREAQSAFELRESSESKETFRLR